MGSVLNVIKMQHYKTSQKVTTCIIISYNQSKTVSFCIYFCLDLIIDFYFQGLFVGIPVLGTNMGLAAGLTVSVRMELPAIQLPVPVVALLDTEVPGKYIF